MRKLPRRELCQLDRATYPEFRDRILSYTPQPDDGIPRAYPGFPKVKLESVKPRILPGLDNHLSIRRSSNPLSAELPSRKTLSRILRFAHGVHAENGRGPVPSAGGLQALELYFVTFESAWLTRGLYHYDRAGHHLSRISESAAREEWNDFVPSLQTVNGGSLLWIVVGDNARVARKYGERAHYFLALEAGHLMQNICLLCTSLDLCTVPLGGFLEHDIARAMSLRETDDVLYAGICGSPASHIHSNSRG